MRDYLFSQREEELMEFLWKYGKPITSREMIELSGDRTWSDKYLNIMLRSLERKKAIQAVGMARSGSVYARQFITIITKEEYIARLVTEKGIDLSSITEVAVAMVKINKNIKSRKKVVEKLQKIISELADGEE